MKIQVQQLIATIAFTGMMLLGGSAFADGALEQPIDAEAYAAAIQSFGITHEKAVKTADIVMETLSEQTQQKQDTATDPLAILPLDFMESPYSVE